MKKINYLPAILLALLFFSHFAQRVSAVELLTNGSFETGNFTGWTSVNAPNPYLIWAAVSAGYNDGFHTASPQHGTRSAMNGVAANAGGIFSLSQDATIPAGNAALLTWRHRFQLDNNSFCAGAACGSATFSVQILNTSNTVLQTLHTVTVGPQQVYDSGWVTNFVNLSAYAGQTIRLRFSNSVTATWAGPGMSEIDGVSINAFVPTAANASVGGRILTSGGQGIRNVDVVLTAPDGTMRFAKTGSFGYYRFDEVEVGQTYIVTISSKRYSFTDTARVMTVNDNVTDVDFIALE